MTYIKKQWRRAFNRDFWTTLTPALLLIAIAFSVAFYFVEPAPPRSLVIAVSDDEGGARYFARRYKEILARDGVDVKLLPTSGSNENIARLIETDGEVDVAFVQSGAAKKESAPHVISLGSLSYTPLWVFHRSNDTIDDLRKFQGKRLAIGHSDSGTHALAKELLEAGGVAAPPTELLELPRDEAFEKLKAGELDAVFIVSPGEAPYLKKLAAVPGVKLMSFSRAEAYIRKFPYLVRVNLPRGVFDLAKDVPANDVDLIAPTAKLVARDSLHPALAYLLLRAATEVHFDPGIFDKAGEFPAPIENGGIPMSSEAKRYYKAGVPLLQRYLPFWVANLVDRLWLMIVPLIAVAVPLMRAVPAVYQWRVRSRVFKWYARLKEIEIELDEMSEANPERARDMLKRLEEIERSVKAISTPLAYTENLYFFREHVDVVRRRLMRQLQGTSSGAPGDAPLASTVPSPT